MYYLFIMKWYTLLLTIRLVVIETHNGNQKKIVIFNQGLYGLFSVKNNRKYYYFPSIINLENKDLHTWFE